MALAEVKCRPPVARGRLRARRECPQRLPRRVSIELVPHIVTEGGHFVRGDVESQKESTLGSFCCRTPPIPYPDPCATLMVASRSRPSRRGFTALPVQGGGPVPLR